MRSLKKFAVLGLVAPLLFSLLSFTNAVGGDDVVNIRVYECSALCDPKIIVSTKDGSKEIILEKSKNYTIDKKNMEIVTGTLSQYLKDGYKMETSNSVLNGNNNLHITTYILTK